MCFLDDAENASKASSTVGGAGPTNLTGFYGGTEGGAKTRC